MADTSSLQEVIVNWPAVVISVMTGFVAWCVWVTLWVQRFNATGLTRKEHAEICSARDGEINTRLDKLDVSLETRFREVKETLKDQDNIAKESRHTTGNQLQTITLQLAKLTTLQDVTTPPRTRTRR